MKNKSYIFTTLILSISLLYGFFYGLYPIMKNIFNNKENFSLAKVPLTPGSFPESVSKPLLNNFYPLKNDTHKGISSNTSSDNYLLYPLYPSAHCETNNKKFWTIPDNGTCSRAEMCETLYNKKTIRKLVVKSPSLQGGIRVNYYNSQEALSL